MKITFLSPPPNLTGGQRVNAIYAERLQARGHEVTVVARKRQPLPLQQRLKSRLKLQKPQSFPDVSHYDTMKAGLKLIDRAGSFMPDDLPDADVLVATWWETAFHAARMPPEKGRQFYFVQHHEVHNQMTRHLSAGSYYLPLKKITIAGWLVDEMARTYGDHDVALVPNSVDQSLFHAPERPKQPRPTVGLMYSTTPFKGLDTALEALHKVQQAWPDLRIIAFSKDPYHQDFALPKSAERHLRPAQDDLRKLYAQCDAFLFASRTEGFGLPVLEAMACRTPVVGTRTGCAPDAITPGRNGYLADIGDAEGLAQGLIQVLKAPQEEWKALSAAAHAYVKDYSWEDATALFEKVLTAP
ncbi:glycosyltransferase family 4 protein [Roseobacter weihaiensis]|uniref:glycosyltransferase family 4 protein n=1 Tax=Roseobacter weihaiensis TaxID=2763262 RepID=UPI001D0B0D53|nr:glycosyltransferase family 4 protein [Roseobacter sp. H9]